MRERWGSSVHPDSSPSPIRELQVAWPCCPMLWCHLLVSHKQGGAQERGALDADWKIVLWIKETKGLCSARAGAYCSSWQLGSLPPSANYPLPPSARQPANPASCLLCDSLQGVQAVPRTDPIHPGFAKTMPESGLLQVVVGKWETATTIALFHWSNSRTMVMNWIWCLQKLRGSWLSQRCMTVRHCSPASILVFNLSVSSSASSWLSGTTQIYPWINVNYQI